MNPTVQSALPRLGLGAVAGFLGALAMVVPMTRQTEGMTPALVATAALAREHPDDVAIETALLVHQAVGTLAGVLYGVGFVVADSVVPDVVQFGGVNAVAHLVAVAAVGAFVFGFFSFVVLDRYDPTIAEERATEIRGGWLRSVVVFGVVLAVVVPALPSVG